MGKIVTIEEALKGLDNFKDELKDKRVLSDYDNNILIDIYLAEKSGISEKIISLYKSLSPNYRPSFVEVYEENKKPSTKKKPLEVKLISLEGYSINTKNQEEYDILMQLYERAGWKTGEDHFNPTDTDVWKDNKKNTCVDAGYTISEGEGYFLFADLNKLRDKSKVIDTWDFIYSQNIDVRTQVDPLVNWFNQKKPKRRSRGTLRNRLLYGDLEKYVPSFIQKIF